MKAGKKVASIMLSFMVFLSGITMGTAKASALSAQYTSGPYYTSFRNVSITGNQRTDIVNIALSQDGYKEGSLTGTVSGSNNVTEYGSWVGAPGQGWCASFIAWCANLAGVPTNVIRETASPSGLCPSWNPYNARAIKAGDILNINNGAHCALVWKTDGSYIYTVEGNISNRVRKDVVYNKGTGKCTWSNYKASITSYCSPNYSSASPTPASTPTPTPTVCSHNYRMGYEATHPHKIFRKCSLCGKTEYTGADKSGEVPSCVNCLDKANRKGMNAYVDSGITLWEDATYPIRKDMRIQKGSYYPLKAVYEMSGSYIRIAGEITKDGKKIKEFQGKNAKSKIDIGQIYGNYDLSALAVGNYTLTLSEYKLISGTYDPSDQNNFWGGMSRSWNFSVVDASEPAQQPQACEHTYQTSYETAHPHKQYKQCTKCSDKTYTGETRFVKTCSTCIAEHTHNYVQKYETSHPHQAYYQCSLCDHKYYDEGYERKANCAQCAEELGGVLNIALMEDGDKVIIDYWGENAYIDEFFIYRAEGTGEFRCINTNDGYTFEDYDIKPGKTYTYYIAGKFEGRDTIKSSTQSIKVMTVKQKKIKEAIEKTYIRDLKGKRLSSKTVLMWKKAKSKYKVDGYVVLRSTNKSRNYKEIGTASKTKFIIKDKLQKGKKYYYLVQGYRAVNGKRIYTSGQIVSVKR